MNKMAVDIVAGRAENRLNLISKSVRMTPIVNGTRRFASTINYGKEGQGGDGKNGLEILGFKAKVARTFWERTRGLIGTKSLAPDEGLLIEKCNAIHMCFMSFPIDAYFLDKDDQVVKVVRNIPPWKLFVWGGRRAAKVLETAVRE